MINLLPDTAKREIRAARTNVRLVKYIVVLVAGVGFLGLVSFGVYTILMGTKASADTIIQTNQSKTSAYASTETEAQSLKASLANAKSILDNEVQYSKVITGIAALMPSGTVLDTLNLSSTTFGTPTTLTIHAKSTDAALSVKDKFQASPLFSNISFVSLSNSAQGQTGAYPVTAVMSLTINRSAAQ